MSRHLWHLLTLVGDVGRGAARELGRFRAIVTDPNDRDEIGDFPEFSRFCQRLLSTRFEPAATHYSCFLNNVGIGNLGIWEIGGREFRRNAVRDLNWAATVFSGSEAKAAYSWAMERINSNTTENGEYYRHFTEEMLSVALGDAIRWNTPFATFVVTEIVGLTVYDTEVMESAKATLDELVNRAAETAQYLPRTQRGFQEPENE
ncbi:MAG TPA: hypothetical protein PJ982_18730 [Lacipirellulaceae bacterium]|nr:hypothetical protein [Lacipirellulaceae bacterium]